MSRPIATVRAESRQIAVVSAAEGYAGILRAFRDRQAELGLSADKIDEIAGGEENDIRYATKWLSGMKALGPKSWGDALGAMAMKLVFIEDDAQLAKIRKHLEQRDERYVRTNARIRVTKWLYTPRSGRKAAKDRHARTPKEQRVEAARKAANTRWIRERKRIAARRCAPGEPQIEMAPESVKPSATHRTAPRKL